MCGIIGYVGKREASSLLLEGLARLEYRGYDSAGIATIHGGQGLLTRTSGRVGELKKIVLQHPHSGTLGIAHTRWATHGEPSERNAHPHTDCTQSVFVAHNGIIENYREIKKMLLEEGHTFTSETDTEVIPHLIEKYMSGDIASAVQEALHHIVGAYGIVAMSSQDPKTLIAARMGSPLVVGVGNEEYFFASDVTAILPYTRDVVYLDDGELAVIRANSLTITDFENHLHEKECTKIEWSLESAEKQGYEHFMLKEIFEQPDAITNSIRGRMILDDGMAKLGGFDQVKDRLRELDRIIIVGMGTARNAGLVGEYMLEAHAGIPVEVEFGAEFGYRTAPLSSKTAFLAISQSGETADTCVALREAKEKGLLTLGLVNVIGSTIARETDAGIYNHIGPEIAVASTKAFISELTILALITVYLGRMRDMTLANGMQILKEIQALPGQVSQILASAHKIQAVAAKYANSEHMFFLGRGYQYPIALEGALKLKEIAYIHAEGYNGGEMKHGPIALIDANFPTFVIALNDSLYEKNISHIHELKVRGGRVIALANEGNTEIEQIADDVIFIPQARTMLSPILSVVPMQLFAYYSALARGCDIDKPKNLAKSVTVE